MFVCSYMCVTVVSNSTVGDVNYALPQKWNAQPPKYKSSSVSSRPSAPPKCAGILCEYSVQRGKEMFKPTWYLQLKDASISTRWVVPGRVTLGASVTDALRNPWNLRDFPFPFAMSRLQSSLTEDQLMPHSEVQLGVLKMTALLKKLLPQKVSLCQESWVTPVPALATSQNKCCALLFLTWPAHWFHLQPSWLFCSRELELLALSATKF